MLSCILLMSYVCLVARDHSHTVYSTLICTLYEICRGVQIILLCFDFFTVKKMFDVQYYEYQAPLCTNSIEFSCLPHPIWHYLFVITCFTVHVKSL